MRDTLLIIHIIGAGTWLGGSMTVAFMANRMRKRGHEAGSAFMEVFGKMGRLYFPPAAIVILITGILLVLETDGVDFEDGFVIIGFVAVVAGALLGSKVFDPIAKAAISAHTEADKGAVRRAYHRFSRYGLLDIAILVFAIYAMVTNLGN